jgi:3-isopropylmalate/(R)-2-methylmalate dehydratase large subunit
MTAFPRTISEKILSAKSGAMARAGDVVVCDVDLILGTDASAPMAIGYFERMGGTRVHDASRIVFALDHYSPPLSASTKGFHDQVHGFAGKHGLRVYEVGEGISHQIAVERGLAHPGMLIVGADSHTVTCGAVNAFATGVGSSDLAAAMLTGQLWFRVPETIRVVLEGDGTRATGVAAKDVALAMVATLGADGAEYHALEFTGPGARAFSLEDRLVLSNLAVEAGAKAAVWDADNILTSYLSRFSERGQPVAADPDARYAREVALDVASVQPTIALPHSPENVIPIADAPATPIHMIFLGTCTGGRVADYHEALKVLERGGGRLADGVQLVVTPASREVERQLAEDGTLVKFARMGATITMPGCGACCGTSGVIPRDGTNVLSTANRNFKARMGNATASIYLASPAACAAAALTGRITDPRSIA